MHTVPRMRLKGTPPPNKGRTYPAEILTDAEVQALLRGCSVRAPTGIRNRALIAVMYRAGLRIAEALALLAKDIDPAAGTIRVRHGKGDKARTVGIDAGAVALVQLWLESRQHLGLPTKAPLFCTLHGTSLKAPYVRELLRRLATKAGIEKRVHPHGLRHTMAAQLAAEGVPLPIIQRQLGHSSAATTSRYLDHLAPQQVIEAMRRRNWASG